MNPKIDLVYKKRDVVGVDIGSAFIKVVQLKKNRNLVRLVGYGSLETPKDSYADGEIKDPKKVAEELKKLLSNPKMGRITARRVASSLPETKIFVRIVQLPEMSKKEVDEAVFWEVDQYIPTPTNELYFDWQILSKGTDEKGKQIQEIMIAAAPKKLVDSYLEVFKIAGLELYSLETSLSAVSRAMVSSKSKDEIVLIIDIGGNATNIAIFDQNLKVTGSIPLGASSFLESVSANTKTDKEKSQNIILKCEDNDQSACKTVISAIQGNLTSISDEVKKLIKYYTDLKEKEKKNIARILICGGSASIPGLFEDLGKKVGINAEIGNPWTNISVYPLKPIPKREAARYTNAVGLALKGISYE